MERTRNLVKRHVLEALSHEPRIEEILDCKVSADHEPPRGTVRIEVTARLPRRADPPQPGRAVLVGDVGMTFRAEPFGVFVDDLVSNLTGGVTRERFKFLPELAPYQLEAGDQVVADSVRVQGLAGNAYTRFRNGTDFSVDAAGTIVWGAPPDAALPDDGSFFYANYERTPDPLRPPRLTDRNPGSVLRTLAESFAREYAVMSRQLEQVYDASFLDTAEGRDLEALAALVGIERRTQLFAVGEVVFSRTTPAPGDIAIEEGTTISTSDLPSVTVASTEARTLRSGGLSVSVPVRSTVSGPDGAAAAGTLTVLHRPILGITDVRNVEPLVFRGDAETDLELRRRASHAVEGAGRSTPGAIVAALLGVEGSESRTSRSSRTTSPFPAS